MGKPVKEKKEKKVVVSFDKIDVTTATEDEIIQSGLRQNVKEDYICYGIMGLIVLLALIPPLMRKFAPKPITQVEKDIVYLTLSCAYPATIDNYVLYSNVKNYYRDGLLTTVNLQYTYKKLDNNKNPTEVEEDDDVPSFSAIEKMREVKAPGFTQKKVENGYEFTADYENYSFKDVEELKDYSYVAGAESDYLKSLGYYCSTEMETVKELVYVDTNKKVE